MKEQLFRLPLLPVLEKRTYPDQHWPRIRGVGGTMTRELHVYDHASAMIALLFVSPNGTVEAFDVEGFNRIGEFASVAEAAAFACADVEMPCLDS
jgi:hypothetical protein